MALRRINTKWRLLLPQLVLMSIIIGVLTFYQIERERSYRREFINQQLRVITDRLVTGIHNGEDLDGYQQFLTQYYEENEFFTGVRITIYDPQWHVVDCTGAPIRLTDSERSSLTQQLRDGTTGNDKQIISIGGEDYYFLARSTVAPDGHTMIVMTALPNDRALDDYIDTGTTDVLYFALILALVAYLVCYLVTRRFTHNINILREFAHRSAKDPDFVPSADFSHDELGDIARQIVQIYSERTEAQERLEREHQVAMNAIEEKTQAKRQLTNNINHELKTPIGVIKGYLDILVDENLDPKTRHNFTLKARDHADRLVNLITDISAITRLEDGQNMISTEMLDFHEVVYNFVADVKDSGVLGTMDITFDVPFGCQVRGNYNLITGALMNLAKNAANYSHGTRCHIEATDSDDDTFTFAFWDDGVGVPAEHLDYIFERFYRIDSGRTRKSGGTGLGLAIVYNTIVAHGGTIKAMLHPQTGGFMVEFTLPRWK